MIDDAKVTGVYTFKLEWDPAEFELRPSEGDKPLLGLVPLLLPSLFTVLEHQLGLRLEPRKVPVDVIVIDHAKKLSETD